MSVDKNPYAIGFGLKPLKYIKQTEIVDEIIDEFNADFVQQPCYMLSGLRGSGKTVTMVEIGDELSKDENWIVIRINPEGEVLEELVAKIYDYDKSLTKFINTEINLSKFGIGVAVKTTPPAASIESALEKILKKLKKQNKKLLVEIDEVSNTKAIRLFSHAFQTYIGEGLPIYLLMTGLHNNIKNLQDEANCTFLYRAEEKCINPLNATLMQRSYMESLGVNEEIGWELAILSKGYPIAYQAIGKYMWEQKEKVIDDEFLSHVDAALSRYVYSKIWSELSDKERWFLSFICTKPEISLSDLLEISGQKKNEFSQYRERLITKGLIKVPKRGVIAYALPRFDAFIRKENSNIF